MNNAAMTDRTSSETETLAAKLEARAKFHIRNCKGSYSYFSDIDSDLMLKAADVLRKPCYAPTPDHQEVRWAVNVLLEKIAEKFDGWETWDLWRSDAAATVRSFKHASPDTSTLQTKREGK